MIEFLTDMPFWAWFLIAGGLLVLELLTGTTFLLWPAIAAAIVGLITTVQLDGQWVTQWLLFAGLTVGLGVLGRPYAERWIRNTPTDKPGLNDFSSSRVGRRGVSATAFVGGQGRIRLGDTEWSARLETGHGELAVGQSVEVTATDGTVMIVRPLGQA